MPAMIAVLAFLQKKPSAFKHIKRSIHALFQAFLPGKPYGYCALLLKKAAKPP
jgi:hypothetical protein